MTSTTVRLVAPTGNSIMLDLATISDADLRTTILALIEAKFTIQPI